MTEQGLDKKSRIVPSNAPVVVASFFRVEAREKFSDGSQEQKRESSDLTEKEVKELYDRLMSIFDKNKKAEISFFTIDKFYYTNAEKPATADGSVLKVKANGTSPTLSLIMMPVPLTNPMDKAGIVDVLISPDGNIKPKERDGVIPHNLLRRLITEKFELKKKN